MPEYILPNGLDRADGLERVDGNFNLGTPTPANAILVNSGGGNTDIDSIPINEDDDSPEIERAEQATVTHRFRMAWSEAKNRIQFYGRGTLMQDSDGNVTKVLSSKIQHQAGDWATLIIVAESVSFDSPPDKFSVVPVELGINIIKHPRYFYSFLGGSATDEALNQSVIRELQNYFENVGSTYRDWLTYRLYFSISTNSGGAPVGGTLTGGVAVADPSYTPSGQTVPVDPIPGTDLAKAAAMEIITKYWRNEETPYIVGYQINWKSYYFRPQYLNPGGYVENPMTEANPQLPDYFSSPNYPPDSVTIFDYLHIVNPQCYSTTGTTGGATNISWMRKADEVDEQRTWFEVTRTWIGSAVGFWDPDLYTRSARPSAASDYAGITPPKIRSKPANVK